MPSYLKRAQRVEAYITFVGDAAPTRPQLGQAYYDHTHQCTKVYNGTTWIELQTNDSTYERLCAFCNTPMKGERCRECGAPMPKEREKKHG